MSDGSKTLNARGYHRGRCMKNEHCIYLEDQAWKYLEELAECEGCSVSVTIERIVEAHQMLRRFLEKDAV
jgi:predicted DNA-binding ribbon-helix-helix protein